MKTSSITENRPYVIYDGNCAFCIKQIDRIKRRDHRNAMEYIPRQTPGLETRFPVLTHADFNSGVRFIAPGGDIFVGSDAFYHILQLLPIWKYGTWLYHVPGVRYLARWVYAWIAANRYRLSNQCESDICELPDLGPSSDSE